jgi:hypothetical protein
LKSAICLIDAKVKPRSSIAARASIAVFQFGKSRERKLAGLCKSRDVVPKAGPRSTNAALLWGLPTGRAISNEHGVMAVIQMVGAAFDARGVPAIDAWAEPRSVNAAR